MALGFGPISSLPISSRDPIIQANGVYGQGIAASLSIGVDKGITSVFGTGFASVVNASETDANIIGVFGTGAVANLVPVTISSGLSATGAVGSLSSANRIEIDKPLTGVAGTGVGATLGAFESSPSIDSVFGTGTIGSLLHKLSITPLGVHGTGYTALLIPVVPLVSVYGLGAVGNLGGNTEDIAVPLGVHGTGKVQVLFIEVWVNEVVREALSYDNSAARLEELIRENLFTDQLGPASARSIELARELLALNLDARIRNNGVVREIITVNNNSFTNIIVNESIRELLALNIDARVRMSDQTRELLLTDYGKQLQSIMLVVS